MGDKGNQPRRPNNSGPPGGGHGGSNYHNPDWGDGNANRKLDIDHSHGNSKLEAYFDNKLHPESVPEWDGNPDTLAQWILKVNLLAQHSITVFKQLGEIVPLRLCKGAEK